MEISATLRARLIEQRRELFDEAECYFPFAEFRNEAEHILKNRASEERLPFVLRCIWHDFAGEPPGHWRERLSDLYDEFVKNFPWDQEPLPPRVNRALLERGLFHAQMKDVAPIKPRHVLRVLLDIRRLSAIGVEL